MIIRRCDLQPVMKNDALSKILRAFNIYSGKMNEVSSSIKYQMERSYLKCQ